MSLLFTLTHLFLDIYSNQVKFSPSLSDLLDIFDGMIVCTCTRDRKILSSYKAILYMMSMKESMVGKTCGPLTLILPCSV